MPEQTPDPISPAAVDETWSQIGRVPSRPGRQMFTIAGRSFCVSGRSGDIDRQGHLGFFADDTRFLSEFYLTVNGEPPDVVDAASINPHEAVFFMRARTLEQDDASEPELVIRRHRYQSQALHEDIAIENHSGGATEVTVSIHVDVDFAELLDIRLGGASPARTITVKKHHGAITFNYEGEGDFRRGCLITTSEDAQPCEGGLRISALIAARDSWKICVEVTPIFDHWSPEPERTCHLLTADDRDPARTMRLRRPRLESSADALEHLWAHAQVDLNSLAIDVNGARVFAAGIPWYVALFGRDSIITSIEAMMVYPQVALATARLLAQLQGRQVNPAIAEEPGKILHELRHADRSSPAHPSRYYGGVDTTCLWCMLLEKLWRWGAAADDIAELLPALRLATDWIRGALDKGDGLLTYEGDNTRLVNQGWKDSRDSIIDHEGRLLEPPIAVVEAQAYAVAALKAAAMLEQDLGDPKRVFTLHDEGLALRRRLDEVFWRAEMGTYDLAVGRDGAPANTLSSNPGHVLWAEAAEPERAAAVATSLTGPELWSGWGLRTLARHHPGYNPISYHRGSVWPHDTMLAIAGLVSYGHYDEAQRLGGGLLAAAADFSYELPELFSGISRDEVGRPIGYPSSSSPQAWAAAVPIYLVEQLLGLKLDLPRGLIALTPRLPDGVKLALTGLKLGEGVLSLRAEGRTVHILELPPGTQVTVR